MLQLTSLLFFCLWFVVRTAGTVIHKDVCVVGAGAAGAYASVYLKDRNYSVVTLEVQSNIGGHCDTVYNPSPPVSYLNWLDIGVAFWIDTFAANSLHLGPWDVDTVSYVNRFAPGKVTLANLSATRSPRQGVDYSDGTNYGTFPLFPPEPPSADYLDALNRYFNLVNNTYPWWSLSDYTHHWYPDQIPADLLQPFSSWVNQHNLTALIPLFQFFGTPAGIPSDEIALWYGLGIPPAVVLALNNSIGFIIFGGCQGFYDSIASYIGSGNSTLITNFVVDKITRANDNNNDDDDNSQGNENDDGNGHHHSTTPPVSLNGHNSVTGVTYNYTCNHLVMAIPPVVSNLNFMDLDTHERNLFSTVQTRLYYDGYVNVSSGGSLASSAFDIRNDNISNSFNASTPPSVIQVARTFPFGPAGLHGYAVAPITTEDFISDIIIPQLANIPSSLTTVTLVDAYLHQYQAHPAVSALNHSGGFFTKLKATQGRRYTNWVGAGSSYSGSHIVVENTYDVLKAEGL